MQLEELPAGGVLEVLLSDERVSADLSRLLSDEGHRVVEVERARPDVWTLKVEKGKQ
jgi:TusA-related sulfurtransferase